MQDPYLPPNSRLSSSDPEENREVIPRFLLDVFWWFYLGICGMHWRSKVLQILSNAEGEGDKVLWASVLLGWIPLLGLLGFILKRRFLAAWVWELTFCLVLVGMLWSSRTVLSDPATALGVVLSVPMAYALWFYQDLFKS